MDNLAAQLQLDPALLQRLMQEHLGSERVGSTSGVSWNMAGDVAPNNTSNSSEDGGSRKYRSGGWELTGPMAALPRSLIHTPNPVVPLKFEQPPGKWEALQMTTTEAANISQFSDNFVSRAVMNAHLKALEAYGCVTWQEAVQTAQQALSISPICPEAYNILALAQADSYEEALESYRKAEELGPKILLPFCFSDMLEERTCWQRTPFRAYYRGLYGVANTLRKMGRYEESLAAYDKLLAADPNWYNWSSYVNVMALYPFVLLGAKGPEAVIRYMRSYSQTDAYFTYISSNVYWVAAYTLADMMVTEAKGTSVKAGGAKMTADDNWAADGLDLVRLPADSRGHEYASVKCRPLFCFCHTFFEAVDMLLGDKALPPGLSCICLGSGKTMVAASLAYSTGSQWRSKPTIMQRLRRYRNTIEVRALVQDLRHNKVKVDIQELRQYMIAPGGFHKGALERELGPSGFVKSLLYGMMDFPDGREFSKDELKVLKWLLDAGVPVTDTHPDSPNDQPLHMACYQGYGPEAVKLLLGAGADPMHHNTQGLSALGMTANQGNWREMLVVLQAMPHLKTANAAAANYCKPEMFDPSVSLKKLTVPEAMIIDLFSSTCLFCLEGGPKCLRCTNGIPHSKHANFMKHAEALVEEADICKLSKQVLEEMSAAARQSGPGSPWSRLRDVVLRAVDRQKKKKAAVPPAGVKQEPPQQQQQAPPAPQQQQQHSKPAAATAAAPQPPPAATAVRACWGCGVQASADQSLQKCAGCRRACYCSRKCQEEAWKSHKADCKKWAVERAAAAKAKK